MVMVVVEMEGKGHKWKGISLRKLHNRMDIKAGCNVRHGFLDFCIA